MTSSAQLAYRFNGFRIDPVRRLLFGADGEPIALKPKVFDTLLYLVERPGELVAKQALLEAVWPHVVVEENNLNKAVSTLRQVFGETRDEHRFIVTEPGRGYRFVAQVEAVPAVTTEQPPARAEAAIPPQADAPAPTSRHPPASAPRDRQSKRPRLMLASAAIAAACAVAAIGVYWLASERTESADIAAPERLPSSVAVLPIQNLSPDAADADFAAGIHTEIIGQLAKVPGLSVIAKTSVQRYANAEKSIQEIAAELNVETVMEGSVRYSGHRVRITTNLIDAATGASRWSEVYDRELGEVFAIQEDIATNIAAALGTEFPLGHRASSHGQATTSPEAAALYLKVLTLQRQCSLNVGIQLQYLDSALAFDPSFANAYAMKAMLYATSVIDCVEGRAVDAKQHAALEKLALDNAAQALELDPTSTQAYLGIALVHQYFWRWSHAIDAYEKAYKLSPNDVEVLNTFGSFLSWSGHHDRAIALLERATQMDPDSPASHFSLGLAFAQAGRTARALTVFRAAAQRAPTVAAMRSWLGRMEAISGDPAQALTEFQAAERLSLPWENPSRATAMLYSYSLIGRSEDVQRLASTVKTMENTGPVGAGTWALMYVALGDAEQTHHWLTMAVEKIERHEPDAGFLNLVVIKANPYRNPMLDEPRFRALRDRIGVLD